MDKEVIKRVYDGRNYTLEYADGSILNHVENPGIAGISSDKIVETVTYPNGSYDTFEYTANGTRGVLGQEPHLGELTHRTPYDATKTYSDGTKEIINYKYDGNNQTAIRKIYDASGKLISEDVINRTKSEHPVKSYDDIPFYGYDEKSKEVKLYDETGNMVSTKTYDASGNVVSNQVAKEMVFNGKVYTFNANELNAIIEAIDSSKTELMDILNNITGRCENLASTIASDDSKLSSLINRVGELCGTCSQLINNLATGLSSDISAYISKTIANEDNISSNLNEINTSLNDVSGILGSIN